MTSEGFIDFKGHQSWYHVAGSLNPTKPALLLLHGGPGGSSDGFEPLDALAEQGRTVVRYDQLGAGRSDRPYDESLWTVETFIEEIQAVRDQLGLFDVHLLGHSWGGMLALEYLFTKPAGVKSLILGSSLASTDLWTQEARRLRADMPRHVQATMSRFERSYRPKPRKSTPPKTTRLSDATIRKRAKTFAKVVPAVSSAPAGWIAAGASRVPFLRRAAYDIATGIFATHHVCRVKPMPIEALQGLAGMNRDLYEYMWGPSEFHATGTLRDWDVTPRLHEIDVPTLIIAGRYDESTPAINDVLERGIPGAERITLEESAHCTTVEEPEAFRSAVEGFIGRHDG